MPGLQHLARRGWRPLPTCPRRHRGAQGHEGSEGRVKIGRALVEISMGFFTPSQEAALKRWNEEVAQGNDGSPPQSLSKDLGRS
jgi:hypothetical protein